MSTRIAPTRPGTAAAASRPRRAFVALGVVAALTGGGLVAQAEQAAPAAAAVHTAASKSKPAPKATLKASRYYVSKGAGKSSRPHLTVKATRSGKAISGRAKLVIAGKVASTKKLRHGKATFIPSWSMYHLGKNRVRIVVDPTSSKLANKSTRTTGITAKKPVSKGAKIVKVANTKVGARYVYGATGPSSFDCSGFTRYVYKKATGKSLPHSSSAQKSAGHRVARSSAKPGDLIWTPGHVAIYIGNGKQIEAARPGVGVVKRHIWQDSPRFIRI